MTVKILKSVFTVRYYDVREYESERKLSGKLQKKCNYRLK